jgi:hypothetical protein
MSSRVFDNIVRPFQSPQVNYPAIPSRSGGGGAAPSDDVDLTFGLEGKAKIYNCSFSTSVNTYVDTKTKEIDRTTHTKRIENKDDPSQFVDVEVVDKLSVESGKQKKYQKTEYEFKNDK